MKTPGLFLILIAGAFLSSCIVYKPAETTGNAMDEVLVHYQVYVHNQKGITARKLKQLKIDQAQVNIATAESNFLNSPSSNYQAYKKKGSSETEVHLFGAIDEPGNFNLNQVRKMLIFSPKRKLLVNQYSLNRLQKRLRFFVKQDDQLIPINKLELVDGKLNFYAFEPMKGYRGGKFGSDGELNPHSFDVFLSLNKDVRIAQFNTDLEIPLEKLLAVNYNQVNVDRTFTNTALAITLVNVLFFSALFATEVITSSY